MTISSQPQDAIRLLGAAASLREKTGLVMMRVEYPEYEQAVSKLRAEVDEVSFRKLWAEGSAMTVDDAINYALEKGEL
jgi:hypothetical protein